MSKGIQLVSSAVEKQYAAVDLGSNSFHLVVVRVCNGTIHIIGKVKQKVRLAAGLDHELVLDDLSMERGWKCLETFAERLQDIPAENIRIVATATLRLAKNASVFVEKAEQILSHKINVISGEEEARQIFLGVAYTSANQGNTLVVDIGGASTEVILGKDLTPLKLTSCNMGCVTYMDRYFPDQKLTQANFDLAIAAAKQELVDFVGDFTCFTWQQCLGASGTPQAIVEILVAQGVSDAIRLSYLHQLRQQCVEFGELEKLDIKGLTEARKAVFPSGLAILIALFESLNIEHMQIAGGALREGLIYGMLDNIQHNTVREQSLNELVTRFHIDQEQSLRVAQATELMFKQVANQIPSTVSDAKELLWAAARLHEIGLHIDYKLSHVHGHYLLSHIQMPGYTGFQQACIRDLVRYHRQTLESDAFSEYAPDIQQSLVLLCRLLRLANVMCIRRKQNFLPEIKLTLKDQSLSLTFPKQWLKDHPLLDAELANERWQQHKAGWVLEFK